MRNPDSPATYCYYGSLFKCLSVMVDHCSDRLNPVWDTSIGEEDESSVGYPSQIDQFSEILVHRDENPVLCPRSLQQSPVAWVRAEGLPFNNIVAVAAKPFGQLSARTSISEESHCPATETGASVSPAITVWA